MCFPSFCVAVVCCLLCAYWTLSFVISCLLYVVCRRLLLLFVVCGCLLLFVVVDVVGWLLFVVGCAHFVGCGSLFASCCVLWFVVCRLLVCVVCF